MINFIGRYTLELSARSIAAAWRTLRTTLEKLSEHNSDAFHGVLADASKRADVATQAGDVSTLVNDQIRMLGFSRERLARHWGGAVGIARQAIQEWASIGRDYGRALKASVLG